MAEFHLVQDSSLSINFWDYSAQCKIHFKQLDFLKFKYTFYLHSFVHLKEYAIYIT